MPDANHRLHLCVIELTTDWQEYKPHIRCRSIEMTADKNWMWCTDRTKTDAVRLVEAFKRELVVDFGMEPTRNNEPMFYFKGIEPGNIWDKCVR